MERFPSAASDSGARVMQSARSQEQHRWYMAAQRSTFWHAVQDGFSSYEKLDTGTKICYHSLTLNWRKAARPTLCSLRLTKLFRAVLLHSKSLNFREGL